MDLKKIKDAFVKFTKEAFGDMPPEKSELKLADGAVIEVDKLEPGGVVKKDGSAAADGVYTLETGESITVAAGLITEVKPKEDDMGNQGDQPPATPPTPPEDKDAAFKKLENSLFEKLNKIEQNFNSKLSSFEKKQTAIENSFKNLNDAVQSFSQETPEPPTVADWESLTPKEKYRLSKGK